jgi:cell division protein FtsA
LSRQALAEVVEPRYDELFTLVQAELRRSGFEDMVPAGIVLTGGTSKMEGVVELAEEIFHMPVRVGFPQSVRGLTDIVRNPIYSTGVGLLQYGSRHQADGHSVAARSGGSGENLFGRMKAWIQSNF